MRPYKSRLIRLRNRLKIRRIGFPLLKTTKRKKKRPLNLKMSGLLIDSQQEHMMLIMLETKLLTMGNIMFAR